MRRRFVLLAALALAVLTLALTSMPRPKALAQARPPAGDDEGWRDELARLAVEIQDQMDEAERVAPQLSDAMDAVERANADRTKAETDLKIAKMALTEYNDGIFPIELRTAEGGIAAAEAAIARAKQKLEIIDRALKQRPGDPSLLLARVDLPNEIAVQEVLIQNAKGQKEQLLRYTKPTQVATRQANVIKCESDVMAKKAAVGLAQLRRAKAERTAGQARPLRQEKDAYSAVSDALALEQQWQAARAAKKPADEVRKLEDRARAQYAEARRSWRDARVVRARQRLGFRD
ncbi:MAG TPA: hypothetical protein VG406_00140 [Isosphaeraceae bacterium]|jgi:hypothetical protein|nr:hypothetical protein [Isosphaeraceae bacterium]